MKTDYEIKSYAVSHKMTQIKEGGIIVDGEAKRIATVNFATDKTNDEANASFIVKAVNCHEELLARAKQALKYLEHPSVQDIKFSLHASVCAKNLKLAIDNAERV